MAEYSNHDKDSIKGDILKNFHQLMIVALRQREGDIIQFVAILAAALAGFGWLAKASSAGADSVNLSSGVFVIGTVGVLLLLTVGTVYALALGYNYRYIILQLAKIEAKWCVCKSMLVNWPRCPDDFIKKYGCYCKPPEIIQVFWIAFLVAIAGVTLSAAFLKPVALVLGVIIPAGCVGLLLGLLLPCRYGRKIRKLAYAEKKSGGWLCECNCDNDKKEVNDRGNADSAV